MQRDLPLSLREAVMVRFDEERADVIKLLIVGCTDTPYAGGCFEYPFGVLRRTLKCRRTWPWSRLEVGKYDSIPTFTKTGWCAPRC